MTDKERLLLHIVREFASTQLLALNGYDEEKFTQPHLGEFVHFRYKGSGAIPVETIPNGTLVLCKGSGGRHVHDWTVGWVVQPEGYAAYLIREIGTNRTCHVSNETFLPILGLTKDQMLEGDEYEFYQKVLKAFARGDEVIYLFGGVDIEGSEVVIWVRQRWGGGNRPSKPFPVRMHWNKRTSIAAILRALCEGGYGTREFELSEDEFVEAGHLEKEVKS